MWLETGPLQKTNPDLLHGLSKEKISLIPEFREANFRFRDTEVEKAPTPIQRTEVEAPTIGVEEQQHLLSLRRQLDEKMEALSLKDAQLEEMKKETASLQALLDKPEKKDLSGLVQKLKAQVDNKEKQLQVWLNVPFS